MHFIWFLLKYACAAYFIIAAFGHTSVFVSAVLNWKAHNRLTDTTDALQDVFDLNRQYSSHKLKAFYGLDLICSFLVVAAIWADLFVTESDWLVQYSIILLVLGITYYHRFFVHSQPAFGWYLHHMGITGRQLTEFYCNLTVSSLFKVAAVEIPAVLLLLG